MNTLAPAQPFGTTLDKLADEFEHRARMARWDHRPVEGAALQRVGVALRRSFNNGTKQRLPLSKLLVLVRRTCNDLAQQSSSPGQAQLREEYLKITTTDLPEVIHTASGAPKGKTVGGPIAQRYMATLDELSDALWRKSNQAYEERRFDDAEALRVVARAARAEFIGDRKERLPLRVDSSKTSA